jgi:RHS repeat-associated protein
MMGNGGNPAINNAAKIRLDHRSRRGMPLWRHWRVLAGFLTVCGVIPLTQIAAPVTAGASGTGTTAGTISTFAGGPMGSVTATQLGQQPSEVATAVIGGTTYAYLGDQENSVVRRINLSTDAETVVAGNYDGGYTGDGGAATSAELAWPAGVAVDANDDLAIADTGNNVVRFVPGTSGTYFGQSMTAGDIYTIAGNATGGYSGNGGAATSAELNGLAGVAFDASGDIAIADTGNNAVRFVPVTSGTHFGQSMTADDIYTIAGNGTAGYSGNGGAATSAKISGPNAVTFDAAGDLYLSDTNNNVVRFVPVSSGTYFGQSMTADDIYTIAGNTTAGYSGNGAAATSAELYGPSGVSIDSSGDLIIGDGWNSVVRFVPKTSGTHYGQSMTADDIYTVAGNGTWGTSGNGGAATSAEMGYPFGVATDSAGDIVISDDGEDGVRIVANASGTLAGQSVTADDIYAIAGDGTSESSYSGTPVNAEFEGPTTVRTDANGDVVIADTNNNAVRFVPATSGTYFGQSMTGGDIYTIAGTGTAGYSGNGAAATSAELRGPNGVAFDANGDIAIADSANNAVRFLPATSGTYFGQSMTAGDIYTIAGNTTAGYSGNGAAATSAEIDAPGGVAFDASGDLVIADTNNDVVRFVPKASGTHYGQSMTADDIYTIAGNATFGYSGNGGAATSAELSELESVTVDSAGDLVIADSYNSAVRFVPVASGTYYGQSMSADDIYTIAGDGSWGYTGDGGAATSAELSYWVGDTTVDSAGDLLIADTNNDVIRFVPVSTGTYYGQSMTADDIYTIAGAGWSGTHFSGDGGPPLSAQFAWITSVAPDGSGGYYIADQDDARIRHVTVSTGPTVTGVSPSSGSVSGGTTVTLTGTGFTSGTTVKFGSSAATGVTVSSATSLTAVSPAGTSGTVNVTVTTSAGTSVTSSADQFTYGFTGAASGDVPSSAMYGGSNPAAPGVTQGVAIVGDGVNPATGDFTLSATDASASTYGPSLSVTRTYDADLAQAQTSPGPFGYGWSFTPTLNPSTLTVTQASGAQVSFAAPSGGSCTAPDVGPGTSGTYCALPYVTASLTSSGSTYTFTTHPFTSYTFNSSGKLTAESIPGGATLTWTYNSPSPGSGKCPSTATSCNTETAASGRALVFGLNSSGLVTTVTDPLSNTWTYAYSSSNLTSVTDPLSRVTSYTYDTSNSNAALRHDLLAVTEPNGQSGGSQAGKDLSNTYNTSGMVTSQSDPMSRSTSYSYSSMNESTGNGDVVVTDPDSNVDEYFYQTGILDETIVGAGSSLPSETIADPSTTTLLLSATVNPDGATTTYTYDVDGNFVSTTNALGETTTSSFNAFDEPVCSTTPMAASPCSSLSPPAAVAPGGTVSPPSSAPPAYTTFFMYDTSGNELWSTMGVYLPGATSPSYSRTTYSLYQGNSVTLARTSDHCAATPPSTSLPCATIDADDYVTQLGYNSAGDVISSATPDGNPGETATTTSTYDADGNQVTTTSPLGNLSGANAANYTTTTTYDADGEPTETVLAGGAGATVSSVTNATYYDPDGNVVATTAPAGNPYSSGNPSGCNPLTTSTCADTTYTSFDAENESTLVTDASGNETLTCYDGDGNVAQTVPPAGVVAGSLTASSCPTSYPSSYGSALVTEATTYTYNAQGEQTTVSVPPATGSSTRATTSNVYDAAGQSVEVEAPPATSGGSDVVTASTYDAGGNLSTTTTAYGTSSASTTSYCYNPDGDKTATVPGTGNTSGVASCSASSPWGTTSSYQTSSEFDSAGNLISSTSPNPGSGSAATTTYTYDPVGNQLTVTSPTSAVTTNTYNPQNEQVSQVTSSGGTPLTSTDYLNANGNEVAVTSPAGNPYSATNTSGCDPVITSTCADTTYNTFNNGGQLLTSENSDGGVTTNYYSASSGNLIATTGPGGNPASCNPTTSPTPCADTTTYAYNSLNQVTCKGEPNASNNTCTSPGSGAGIVKYTYNQAGNVLTMTDATGTTTNTYDSAERLVSTTNGAGAVVTYAYGQNSDITCVSYPNASNNTCTSPGSGVGIVDYSYNSSNQPSTMTDWAGNTLAYSYNAAGQQSNLSVNSGAVGVATDYTNAGDVVSIDATASSGATQLLNLSVTRTPNGQIATEVPTVGSTTMATDSFGYNTNNRVSTGPIAGTTGSTAYSYVPDGGISGDTNTFASAGYDSADRLCWTSTTTSTNACTSPPSGATTYGTNADGERTSMTPASGSSASYGWDTPTGDLMCANVNGTNCSTSSPTSSTTVYSYNGSGLRATSTIGSTTTKYTWGNINSSPQDLSNGTWDYLYLPGSSVPTEQIAASGSSPAADLLLSDPNGSVRGIVQLTSGTHQDQLVNYTDYDAYGNPITQSGGSVEGGGLTATHTSINANYVATTQFGFGGGYTDATGLVYLVHRYYDPATGQFLSVDPDISTTNQAYEYAGDDPVDQEDPSGLDTLGICAGAGAQFGPIGISAGYCLTRTIDASGEDDIGLTATLGGTIGAGVDVGFGLYYQISNATNLYELGGVFDYVTVGAGLLVGGSVDAFTSLNGSIYGIDAGVGVEDGIDFGVGRSDTAVVKFNGVILANIARGIWDALNPELDLARELSRASNALGLVHFGGAKLTAHSSTDQGGPALNANSAASETVGPATNQSQSATQAANNTNAVNVYEAATGGNATVLNAYEAYAATLPPGGLAPGQAMSPQSQAALAAYEAAAAAA